MPANDSIKQTLIVATLLCLVCSVVVSATAVVLKPIQLANKNLDKQANILSVVNLLEDGANIQDQFDRYIETRIVDLDTGKFIDDIDSTTFDQRNLAKDPATSITLSQDQDKANIKRRANQAAVYLVKQDGKLKYVVLPVHGYGLWSTMYGFIALENDFNTIYGLSFYEHAETPGLGGEIDNPNWREIWQGKKIYFSTNSEPALRVIKGKVPAGNDQADYQIDGIAGATLTARGVGNMIEFWFSEQGFQPFLRELKAQG